MSSLTAILVVVIIVLAGTTAYAFSVSKSGSTSTVTQVSTQTVQVSGSTTLAPITETLTSTVTASVTKTASTSSSQSLQFATLEQLAEQEGGQVTFYSTLAQSSWTNYFAPALKLAFPWLNVNFVALTTATASQKVLAECQAHNVVGDVISSSYSAIGILYNEGCILSWNDTMETFSGFNPSLIDPNGAYHVFTQNPIGLDYNTNLVKNIAELPQTWTDLANPIWKGQICMDDPSTLGVSGDLFADYSYNLTTAQWQSDLKAIAANNPVITSSSANTFSDVASGQCAIGIDLASDWVNRGNVTNVGFTWPFNPLPINAGSLGVTSGSTHPYAAELLIEWLQSYSGQAATLASGRAPVLPALNALGLPGLTLPKYTNYLVGGPGLISNSTKFSSTYTNIFGP